MPPSAERLAVPTPLVRTAFSLAALAASYVAGFAAVGVLSLPIIGGWGVILAIGGTIIALPFLGVAALVLIVFQRSIAAYPLAWCIGAPPAILVAWLVAEYASNYRFQGFSVTDYLALQNVIERAVLVIITAGAASVSFYVIKPRILRRFARVHGRDAEVGFLMDGWDPRSR